MKELSNFQKLTRRLGNIVGVEFGGDHSDVPSAPPDPVAEAELDGSLIMGRYRPARTASPTSFDDPASEIETGPQIVDGDGNVHFDVLYQQAGVPKAQFTSEQAMDLQKQIPPGSDARQVQLLLTAVFKSFGAANGATPEAIVIDANNKKEAIDDFLRQRDTASSEMQAKLDAHIADLQQAVLDAQSKKQQVQAQFERLKNACLQEEVSHEQVIKFFALHADTISSALPPK